MASFQPVPTYADPVLVDQKSGKSGFNPVWLSWFLTLTNGGLGSITPHNSLAGLQGGLSGQYYHLTLTEYQNIVLRNTSAPFNINVPASPFNYQNTNAFSVEVIVDGTGAVISLVEFSRDNVTYHNVGDVAGMFTLAPGDHLRVTYGVGTPTLTGIPQ